MNANNILKFVNVSKDFNSGGVLFTGLKSVSLEVNQGEFIGLSGKSGSGKTTLLNIAGLIDPPSSGELFLRGKNISTLHDNELSKIRANEIGFIFQTFNLLPLLSALENVEYPLSLLNLSEDECKVRAMEALKKVGLENFSHHRPSQLSGGQRQRVAIARAIVKNPSLILADEPTANLDSKTSEEILDILISLQKDLNVTIMLCSHDPDLISLTKRQIKLQDGIII